MIALARHGRCRMGSDRMGDISQRLRVKPTTPTLLLLLLSSAHHPHSAHHRSSTLELITPGLVARPSWISTSGNSSHRRWPVLGPNPTPIRAASRYRCIPEPHSLSQRPSLLGLTAWTESSCACDSNLAVFLLGKSSLDGIPAHPSAALSCHPSKHHHHCSGCPSCSLIVSSVRRCSALHSSYPSLALVIDFWSSTLDVHC